MRIALVGDKTYPERWLPLLRGRLPGDEVIVADGHCADDVDVALVGTLQGEELVGARSLKLVQCLWMGVDDLLARVVLPDAAPLARMVDPSMVAAMTEMVVSAVLDHHRHLYAYRTQQREQRWAYVPQRRAAERRVAILGMGALGRAAAGALRAFGFGVSGWSRSPRSVPGVAMHCGDDGGHAAAAGADFLVCLLPLTDRTSGVVNAALLARLSAGAGFANFARGAHVIDEALLGALDSGQVVHAWLDAFAVEPLPPEHRYWNHPSVTVTPHMAARTVPATAIDVAIDNIERVRRGEPPLHLVDQRAGY